jgi:hypothetical protein
MKRPSEVRASPKDWIAVLQVAYQTLLNCGISNLLLFGSQAMSFYMNNPLRSKDIDLLTNQMGPTSLDELTKVLTEQHPAGAEVRTNDVHTRFFDGRTMRTYSVELRIRKRPFFVEIFDAVLDGQPPAVLTPYVQRGKRWNLDLWVPSREALVGLRLCFRQPEGISRLNASRLNLFIEDNEARLNEQRVGEIIVSWGQAELVRRNLEQLEKLHNTKITAQQKILAAMKTAEQKH